MDRQTIATYDTFAKEYDQETAEFWETFPHSFIQEFSKSIAKSGLILDAGSGPGRDAELLRKEGLNLICLDASAAMIKITEEKGFTSVQGDILSLPFPDNTFAGIWAYTSLIHLPRKYVVQALSEMARVLSPQGVCGIGVIEGEGKEVIMTTSLVRAPRLFTYFRLSELQKLLNPYFDIVYKEHIQPNRRKYLHILANKKVSHGGSRS